MHRLKITLTGIAVFGAFLFAQGYDARGNETRANETRIGDNYARAALRAVIYSRQGGVDAQQISFLLSDADVEASTPAEEASLKEINRIMGRWYTQVADNSACYQALKSNLKARNGAMPEVCK